MQTASRGEVHEPAAVPLPVWGDGVTLQCAFNTCLCVAGCESSSGCYLYPLNADEEERDDARPHRSMDGCYLTASLWKWRKKELRSATKCSENKPSSPWGPPAFACRSPLRGHVVFCAQFALFSRAWEAESAIQNVFTQRIFSAATKCRFSHQKHFSFVKYSVGLLQFLNAAVYGSKIKHNSNYLFNQVHTTKRFSGLSRNVHLVLLLALTPTAMWGTDPGFRSADWPLCLTSQASSGKSDQLPEWRK